MARWQRSTPPPTPRAAIRASSPCLIEFEEGSRQTSTVTVDPDGTWVASPGSSTADAVDAEDVPIAPTDFGAMVDAVNPSYPGIASKTSCEVIRDSPALFHCTTSQPSYKVVGCWIPQLTFATKVQAVQCPTGLQDDVFG